MAFKSISQEWLQSNCGRMSIACNHCLALHWLEERTTVYPSTKHLPLFSTCCNKGDVVILLMRQPPLLLQSLYNDDTSLARHFRTHIRKYNSALAFVSLKY